MLKIYVASSWKNKEFQQLVVKALREEGHEVYDFTNPYPGNNGFSWTAIDPNWRNWTALQYREALKHPIAQEGFNNDMTALDECELCVLVMPGGRSAGWEFGWAMGAGKKSIVLWKDGEEADLMFSSVDAIVIDVTGLLDAVHNIETEVELKKDMARAK